MINVGWNYLSIPKRQRNKYFHLTLYCACSHLSILGLKSNHVTRRGPCICIDMCFTNICMEFKTHLKQIQKLSTNSAEVCTVLKTLFTCTLTIVTFICSIPQSSAGHVDPHCGTGESANHCLWTRYREMLSDNHGKNLTKVMFFKQNYIRVTFIRTS